MQAFLLHESTGLCVVCGTARASYGVTDPWSGHVWRQCRRCTEIETEADREAELAAVEQAYGEQERFERSMEQLGEEVAA